MSNTRGNIYLIIFWLISLFAILINVGDIITTTLILPKGAIEQNVVLRPIADNIYYLTLAKIVIVAIIIIPCRWLLISARNDGRGYHISGIATNIAMLLFFGLGVIIVGNNMWGILYGYTPLNIPVF